MCEKKQRAKQQMAAVLLPDTHMFVSILRQLMAPTTCLGARNAYPQPVPDMSRSD